MNPIDPSEPRPRREALPVTRFSWTADREEVLPIPEGIAKPFAAVVDSRRSTRRFSRLAGRQLSSLLWHSAGCRAQRGAVEFRAAPSAGGIHPIHVLVHPLGSDELAHYDSQRHVLGWSNVEPGARDSTLRDVQEFMAPGQGMLLFFVAEPQLTGARYENHPSLVWRDAGILQGQFALVAAGLDLAFCLLGATGSRWLPSMLSDTDGKLIGVGTALVGASE